MLPEQQQRIMGYFIEEAKDHLNTIEQGLLSLQTTIEDAEKANELFRAAHSVKGGAAMLGLESIQTTAHRMEDYFKILKESPVQVDSTLETMFLKISDGLKDLLEQLEGPFGLTPEKAQEIMSEVDPVFGQLEQHLNTLVAAGGDISLSNNNHRQNIEASLQNSFKQDVAALLRELLTTFKQADTSQSRQTLQDICIQLNTIGEQFELAEWCDLSETAKLASANLSNEYRVLAPVLIKAFKKSQDLVLAGRASEVAVSDTMQALLPENILATANETLADEATVNNSTAAEPSDQITTANQTTTEEFEDTTFDLDFEIPDLSTPSGKSLVEEELFGSISSDSGEDENLNELFGFETEADELSGLADFNLDQISEADLSETASTLETLKTGQATEAEDTDKEDSASRLSFDLDFNEIPSELSALNRDADNDERVDESLDALLATVNVTGPAVGEEELNSLADLFDGDLEELDNTLGGHPFVSEEMRLHPERIDMEEEDDLTDLLGSDDATNDSIEAPDKSAEIEEDFDEDLFGGTLTEGGFANSDALDWATDFSETNLDNESHLNSLSSAVTETVETKGDDAQIESSPKLTQEIAELKEDVWREDIWDDTEADAEETDDLSDRLMDSALFGEDAGGLFEDDVLETEITETKTEEIKTEETKPENIKTVDDHTEFWETQTAADTVESSEIGLDNVFDSEVFGLTGNNVEETDISDSNFAEENETSEDEIKDKRDEQAVEIDSEISESPVVTPVSLFSSESVSPSEQEIEFPTLTGVKLKEAESDIDSFFLDLDSDEPKSEEKEKKSLQPNLETATDSLFEAQLSEEKSSVDPWEELSIEELSSASDSSVTTAEHSDTNHQLSELDFLSTEIGEKEEGTVSNLDRNLDLEQQELTDDLFQGDELLSLEVDENAQSADNELSNSPELPLVNSDIVAVEMDSTETVESSALSSIAIEETHTEKLAEIEDTDFLDSAAETDSTFSEDLFSSGEIGKEESLDDVFERKKSSIGEEPSVEDFLSEESEDIDSDLSLELRPDLDLAEEEKSESLLNLDLDLEENIEIEDSGKPSNTETNEPANEEGSTTIEGLFEDEFQSDEEEPEVASLSFDDIGLDSLALDDIPDQLERESAVEDGVTAATHSKETSQSEDEFPTLGLLLEDPFDETVSTLEKTEESASLDESSEQLSGNLSDSEQAIFSDDSSDDFLEDGFDDLEALLEETDADVSTESNQHSEASTPAISMHDTPTIVGAEDSSLSEDKDSEDEDFGDLERLLDDGDGESLPAVAPRRVAQRPARRGGSAREQNMRVPVKHLDNLSNLVGELVVSRNTLERDQERLRQFLDNLLFQVQQLNDVGQRMRDLYERSLLESSLVSNRRAYAAGNSQPAAAEGHATGATFDALEMDRFTGFHTLSQEMIELIVRVRESSSDIGYTVESSDQVTRQFRQITTQLQEGLNTARMVAFSQAADRLPRAVRDISLKCGKEARLVVEGKDTLIDKMIVEHLYDPLTHLVNNAITHGIETPDARQAAGKPTEGAITVQAFYQGNQTVIYVADDGGGINPAFVQKKAVQKGLITQAEADALSDIETYELLFHPGFSTRDQADDFAGRGVGMDVVRTSLAEIRGVITIDSEQGKGTSFTIRLPLTLSISKALSCVSNQARIAFPMDGVEDMVDVPRDRLIKDDQGRDCVKWRDRILPFQVVTDLLKFNRTLGRGRVYGGSQDDDVLSIIVLRSANTFVAIQVDQVIGEEEIVIKQLEGPVPKPLGIAGATILGDGRVMPIADVLELIDIAMGRVRKEPSSLLWEEEQPEVEEEEVATKTDPTVLIVDDSITVRELLSMSFNKVGYRVEQARDGQEAWDKLRSGLPCDLVFCDIEMPRMDGLELLSRMQKDNHLKQVPIAMLTSRGADRHRQMAVDLGASGYFTKPYLEEALLDAAQRMLNGETLEKGRGG
ncbi:MAG: response regulator [Cyanobacteria bacterium J06650_10]